MQIRCSSLTSYPDCPRRAACSLIRDTIHEHGYILAVRLPSVGALIGTAVHAAAVGLVAQRTAGAPVDVPGNTEIARENLRASIALGAVMDATTPERGRAADQVAVITATFASDILPRISGGEAEVSREATVSGTPITGHIDLLTARGALMDWKFGSVSRLHHGQMGGYSLVQRATAAAPSRLAVGYVPRVGRGKPQPPGVITEYDIGVCERVASSVISRMMADCAEYERSQDPHAFLANTGSMMCSEKYCPAYGTEWCEETCGA